MWNTSVCSQRRVHKLTVTLVFVCVHKLRCASHMVITTVMHARLRRVAGVHKYDDGKHNSHFCPLTKVAQYFLGYKRSASTLTMQCSIQFLAFVQYSFFESPRWTLSSELCQMKVKNLWESQCLLKAKFVSRDSELRFFRPFCLSNCSFCLKSCWKVFPHLKQLYRLDWQERWSSHVASIHANVKTLIDCSICRSPATNLWTHGF